MRGRRSIVLQFARFIHIRLLEVRQLASEKGQGLVEYSLILALISIVALLALTAVGARVNYVLEQVRNALPSVPG
jgi:pilus assembly protein Flp/PilA